MTQKMLFIIFCLIAFNCIPGMDGAKFTMTTLESPIRDAIWVGESDQILFTITEEGHVWRSVDGGISWKDQTVIGKIPKAMENPNVYGNYIPPKGIQALLFHESAPKRIFFRGGADTHVITEDYGETYELVSGPAGHLGYVSMRLHPVEPKWILAIARRWGCWADNGNTRKSSCADDLFVTRDWGRSWTNLTAKAKGRIISFVDFDWGWSSDMAAPQNKVYTKETILASVYENRADVRKHFGSHGTSLQGGWDRSVDLVSSTDMFKSKHTKLVPCGNQFEVMNGKMFLAVAAACGKGGSGSGVRMMVSADSGAHGFTDSCFPVPLSERGYSVVDATEHAVYVNVDYSHASTSGPAAAAMYGDVFVSDANFTMFTHSLEKNARAPGGAVDFAPVQGLPGVYIANQVIFQESDEGEGVRHSTQSQSRGSSVGVTSGSGVGGVAMFHTVTKISFNGGGSWQPLVAPRVDSNGHPLRCTSDTGCSLHLHGTTSWGGGNGFAFVYSHATTPGLIISTGNVGQYLYQGSSVNTYLSRDGGHSWEEMRKGGYIYEFGDSGGVIVMAAHGSKQDTDHVLFSLDEGLTWEVLNFTSEGGKVVAMGVFNIRVEPDNVGKKFIVQGLAKSDMEGDPPKGILLAINFGKEGYAKYKECEPKDYEWWTPCEEKCLLGKNISFHRQVRASQCWNGDHYRQAQKSFPCDCEEEDYQCDFGYMLREGQCKLIQGFQPSSCHIVAEKGYMYSTSKKRTISGNECQNPTLAVGVHQQPSKVAHSIWKVLLISITLVGLALAVVLIILKYDVQMPNAMLSRIPYFSYFEKLRYQKLNSNFQSLAEEFGLAGGDEDYMEAEEMFTK